MLRPILIYLTVKSSAKHKKLVTMLHTEECLSVRKRFDLTVPQCIVKNISEPTPEGLIVR